MPPPLAACFFAGFIAWLFHRYRAEAGAMSPGLWIPCLWITINASRPLAYWFANGTTAAATESVLEGSFIDRSFYLFLIMVGVLILSRRRIEWHRVVHACRWLLLLYGYYLLSTLWSDYTYVSFKRWFKDAGDIVMILVLLTEADPVEAVRAVFIRCVYVIVPVSVLFIKYYPALGRYTHRWTYETFYSGVTVNKNSLGLMAMLSALLLVWQVVDVYPQRGKPFSFRSSWPDLIVVGMCLWLLQMAGSATSSVCFVLGCAILLTVRLSRVKPYVRDLRWCMFGLIILILVFTMSSGLRGLIAPALGRDATMTDRTLIWDEALAAGANPVIGTGFDSFWLTHYADRITEEFHVPHAHNGYLETYLNTGIIGVLLLLIVLFMAGKNAAREVVLGNKIGYLFLTFILVGLIYNYTEVTFGRSNVMGLVIWLVAVYGPQSLVDYEPQSVEFAATSSEVLYLSRGDAGRARF